MSTTIDTEDLIAYLDGELSVSQRRDLERSLKDDPEARALLERLSETNRLLHEVYDPVESEPIPVELVEAVSNMAVNLAPAQPRSRPAHRPVARLPGWGFAVAASFLALVVGGMGGMGIYWMIDRTESVTQDRYVKAFEANAEQALMEVLENKPSGTRVSWHDARADAIAEFTVIRTYQEDDGTRCRLYQRTLNIKGVETRSKNLACKRAKEWKTEARMVDNGSVSF